MNSPLLTSGECDNTCRHDNLMCQLGIRGEGPVHPSETETWPQIAIWTGQSICECMTSEDCIHLCSKDGMQTRQRQPDSLVLRRFAEKHLTLLLSLYSSVRTARQHDFTPRHPTPDPRIYLHRGTQWKSHT